MIQTDQAPEAIGTYSQAICVGEMVYLSGQIPILPETMEVVSQNFKEQAEQVFKNLSAVCIASGGALENLVKLNVYLTDLDQFGAFNQVMSNWFSPPYPARALVQVSRLPKQVQIEIDGMMIKP